jgi:hypothetical protein
VLGFVGLWGLDRVGALRRCPRPKIGTWGTRQVSFGFGQGGLLASALFLIGILGETFEGVFNRIIAGILRFALNDNSLLEGDFPIPP